LKAYSDSYSDLAMLEMAAQATAVNPDRKLRLIAAERNWPVVVTKGK
jgi:phosphoserine phosphatase